MSLLNRLNLFKRVKELEIQETSLLNNIDVLRVRVEKLDSISDELETSITHILEYMDKRAEALRELNKQILQFKESQTGSLDLVSDLDMEVTRYAA